MTSTSNSTNESARALESEGDRILLEKDRAHSLSLDDNHSASSLPEATSMEGMIHM
jgi:hypothetical protein